MSEKKGCRKFLGIADEFTEHLLGKLGSFVGRNPGYFVIIPPLCCIIFLTSFQNMKSTGNNLQEFLPKDRRSKNDRITLVTNFPVGVIFPYNDDRIPVNSYRGEIIFRAKDGGSVLRTALWKEILALDAAVQSFSVPDTTKPGIFVGFKTNCANLYGQCVREDFFSLTPEVIAEIESGKVPVTIPTFTHPALNRTLSFVGEFGGPIVDANGSLVTDGAFENYMRFSTVLAVKAKYIFLYNPPLEDQKGYDAWEIKFGEIVSNFSSTNLDILWYTATEDAKEGDKTTMATVPLIGVSAIVILIYCLLATLTTDWVRSKPYVAFFGVLSTCMGTGTAFGLCLYAGVGFSNINYVVPFLMLGIGMDDTFVMLSAWRHTSLVKSVPERMKETYTEAAVSLLISTLTDVISYWIGAITPFPAVGTFCIYAGTSVMILYIFHLTFFGGVLAVSGYAEAGNRHSVTCMKIPAKSEAQNRSGCFKLFCTGGITKNHDGSFYEKLSSDVHQGEVALDRFFREKFAPALCSPITKVMVLGFFLLYLAGAIYGIVEKLDRGLDRKSVLGVNSPVWKYFAVDDEQFYRYPYKVQIVITQPLNYSSPTVRKQLLGLLETIEDSSLIADRRFTQFWLINFLDKIADPKSALYQADISNEQSFILNLKRFLADPANAVFTLDVRLASAGIFDSAPNASSVPAQDSILASRFLVQATNLVKAYDGALLMDYLRSLCDSQSFKAIPYYQLYDLYDQSLDVLPTLIQDALTAGGVMLAVSILMIPNPISGVCITLTICTIETGVMGYMALWNVRLDPISMICCIMCIGFSVEFSTHVSHAYVSSKQTTKKDKIKEALNDIGTPIIQGGLSMIIATIPMAFSQSYMFTTFFKITFMVTLFGMAHGLVILPLALSLLDCSTAIANGTCCSWEKPEHSLSPSRLGPGSTTLQQKLFLSGNSSGKHVKDLRRRPPEGGAEIFFVSRAATKMKGNLQAPNGPIRQDFQEKRHGGFFDENPRKVQTKENLFVQQVEPRASIGAKNDDVMDDEALKTAKNNPRLHARLESIDDSEFIDYQGYDVRVAPEQANRRFSMHKPYARKTNGKT